MNKLELGLTDRGVKILTDIENRINLYKKYNSKIDYIIRLNIPSMFRNEKDKTHDNIRKYLYFYIEKFK